MKTTLISFFLLAGLTFTYAQSISAIISPNPVDQGNSVTIDVTFTSSNSTDIIQLNLERVDENYEYVSTIDYQEYVVPSTGTDQTVQYTVTIPMETSPSSSIATDFYYYKIELRDSSYNWLSGYYEDPLTVNAALSVSGFSSKTVGVYPNPVETFLHITSEQSLAGKSYTVYNLLGKQIMKNKFLLNDNIDVMNLSSGFYILKFEDLAPVKFLKK